MQQRTEEWFMARCGRVGASRIADVVARTKSGYAAARANYMAELVCERLTGKPTEGFSNAAMAWGVEHEAAARDRYSLKTGELVTEVGFINHPIIQMAGASPDGLVGTEGVVELKAPQTHTHIEWLLDREPPQRHFYQVQWQLACTGRAWGDWVSYDPRMPEKLQLLIVRIPRDDDVIRMLEAEVQQFLDELDTKVAKLKELQNG